MKFLSRKFIMSILSLLSVSIISSLSDIIDKLSPFMWAVIGISAMYLIVEGIPDAIERIVRVIRGEEE